MKYIMTFISLIMISAALVACGNASASPVDLAPVSESVIVTQDETTSSINNVTTSSGQAAVTAAPIEVEYDQDDLDTGGLNAETTTIHLNGNSADVSGAGVTVNGNIVTIQSAGTYELSGTLNDGRIIVDSQDQETVVLLLAGVDITSDTSSPLTINSAEKTVITLVEGSENRISDASSYVYDDAAAEEPNAAIFSKDDLTINGTGSLVVEGNFNHGIASKDDLKITGGDISVTAVNDAIKGRDSIAVLDSLITIVAGGDGMQSNNDVDAEKGVVVIEGGTLDITAGLDGIQAENSLLVSGGEINILTGGGSRANYNVSESAKGLKAGLALTVSGGDITIDSADDAVHSNGDITIDGGQLVLSTADDGMHAEDTLTINGGQVTIIQSYEGLEAKDIVINDGVIRLASSDDGINGSSGTGGQGMGGRPGGGFMAGDSQLTINGGYIAVDAWGDGLDINGPVTMTGGVVLVNGPVENNNGPLDYTGSFDISGGFVVAAGSAGMAQAPTASTNSQYSVMVNFPSTQQAGTIIHIQDQSGNDLLTFAPTKQFQSLLLSSPELEGGVTYTVYAGGSASGNENDSLYTDGSYTPGTEITTFTTSSVVTLAGSAVGAPGGGQGARPPRGG